MNMPKKNLSLTGKALTGSDWIKGEGATLDSYNPLTNAVIWSGYECEETTVNQACEAAASAFESWSKTSFERRCDIVAKFVEQLNEHSEELAQAIHEETGKPLWEASTEVASMKGKFQISLDAYEKRTGVSEVPMANFSARLCHRPIGVFAVLGPFNFPGHLPNGHIVPALIAGNTIIFKPSEQTPMVGELMVRLWLEAGLPDGVLNLVQGGRKTGELLTAHPGLNGLLFTGSATVGKSIHAQFAGQPEKMLALEMGGNNPLIVEQSSNIDAAVNAIIQSAYATAGQRCTCARRLILTRNTLNEEILSRLVQALKTLRVGGEADSFMGSVINNQAADNLLNQQNNLIRMGAQSLLAMSRIHADLPLLTPGLIDITVIEELADDESFGPLLQIKWVDDFEQAIHEANKTAYGLSAGLISDSKELWQRFYERSNAGILNWNRPLTGASSGAPFGGTGSSGNFRPSAYYAADYCAYPVASLIEETISLPETLSPGITL